MRGTSPRLALMVVFIVSLLVPKFSGADESKFTVGVVLPLSGQIASMGEAFRKGFALYEEENPNNRVKFIFDDSKYDGKTSIGAMHKIHEIDKADLIVVWGNTPSDSCAPVAEENGIPLLGISMNPISKGRRSVIALGPPLDKMIAKVLEQFKAWNLKKPGAVSIDIGNALKGVEDLRKELGENFYTKTISNDETDFKTLIVGLRAKGVDGLFLLTMPEQALTFVRQASQLKYFPKVVGGDVFADAAFREQATRYLPDLSFVYGGVEESFIARLKKRWNNTSYFFETATGYTLAVLADRLAKDLTATRAKGAIEAIKKVDFSGVPVLGLKLLDTEEYGVHFETDGAVYKAKD